MERHAKNITTPSDLTPRMDGALPAWLQLMRKTAQESITEADVKEIVQSQVKAAKGGDKNAIRFVFEQILGGGLKGATFVQNNFTEGTSPRRALPAGPRTPAALPAAEDGKSDDDEPAPPAADGPRAPAGAGNHVSVLAIPGGMDLPARHGNDEPGMCRVCGCTEDHACQGADGEPCAWCTDSQDLCTSCAQRIEALLDTPSGRTHAVEKHIREAIAKEDNPNVLAIAHRIAKDGRGSAWRCSVLLQRLGRLVHKA